MFNRLVIFTGIAAYMLLTLRFIPLVVAFWLNQTYIIENLCINRQKPELACNGKCYLKKKIKESDSKKQNEEVISFSFQIPDFNPHFPEIKHLSLFINKNSKIPSIPRNIYIHNKVYFDVPTPPPRFIFT
jgi:hypothetical protein